MARTKLSDPIVTEFLRQIAAGELAPGSPLPTEAALAESHGVGRSVARDVLQVLAAKGFAAVRQGSVAVVAPAHRWNVLDRDFLEVTTGDQYFDALQEARDLFEPSIARLAASRGTLEIARELHAANDALADALDEPERHADLDIAFHDVLVRATGNVVLVSLHQSITGLGRRARVRSAAVPGAIERAIFWHGQIATAVGAGDPEGAAAAMQLHMRQARSELSAIHPTPTEGASS